MLVNSKDEKENAWRIPAVVVPPGAFLVIMASGKNRSDPTLPFLHTDFKLKSHGREYLALKDPHGAVVWEHDVELGDSEEELPEGFTMGVPPDREEAGDFKPGAK